MSIADELSEVVLVVNGLVESLERDEEQQEQDFFRSERLAIEIEFETRLAEIRQAISKHAIIESETRLAGGREAIGKQLELDHNTAAVAPRPIAHKSARAHATQQPQPQTHLGQQPTLAAGGAAAQPAHAATPVAVAQASPAPRIPQPRQAASPAPVPASALVSAPVPAAAAPVSVAAPAAAAASPAPAPLSPANVAAAVAASSGVAPLGSAHQAAAAPSAASSPSPSTLIVEFGADATPMRLSLEALSSSFPGLDAHAHRDGVLSVPTVEHRVAKMILSAGANRRTQRAAALSRAENERVRASQGNGFRVVLSEENRTEELIPDSALQAVVDACNTLRIPWLFCLCASRLFASRPRSDLAWLHNLVATSVLNNLPVRELLVLQEDLLHANSSAIHAAMSPEMRGLALTAGASSPDSLKAVLNMVWFLRVSREFAHGYKSHLKRRTTMLAAAAAALPKDKAEDAASASTSASPAAAAEMDYSWLDSAPPASPAAASAEGSPAPAPAAKRSSAPSILWCRLYFELLFAQHLLQLGSASASSAGPGPQGHPAMKAAAEEALQLWREAGSLPVVLLVDLGLLSASGSHAPLRVALHFLQSLVKELPRLGALRIANVTTDSGVDPASFVRLLATCTTATAGGKPGRPREVLVVLHNVRPFLTYEALESLQLPQYFPHIRVNIE